MGSSRGAQPRGARRDTPASSHRARGEAPSPRRQNRDGVRLGSPPSRREPAAGAVDESTRGRRRSYREWRRGGDVAGLDRALVVIRSEPAASPTPSARSPVSASRRRPSPRSALVDDARYPRRRCRGDDTVRGDASNVPSPPDPSARRTTRRTPRTRRNTPGDAASHACTLPSATTTAVTMTAAR